MDFGKMWCLYLCLLAPVLLDDAYASDVNLIISGQQRFRATIGSSVTVSLRRESGSTEGCWVMLPNNAEAQQVTETSAPPGVSLGSRPNSISACNIIVGPVTETLVGHWTLLAYFEENNVQTEARQPFVIELDNGITVLPLQEFWTYHGASVDLSLSAVIGSTNCFLIDPEGGDYNMNSLPYGVKQHTSTKYTSCAVTFTSVNDTQLGVWTLIERTNTRERHQPAVLIYADPSEPELWQVATAIERRITTSQGSTVTLSVGRPEGFFLGCFVTTPDGITLPAYSKDYPGITFVISNSVSACNINVGPLDNAMFGHWILAARFDIDGIPTEIQQPYRVLPTSATTILPRIRYATAVGQFVDINLNQTGGSSTCRVRDPGGMEHFFSGISIPGVQVQSSSNLVSCRILIGPMTSTLLGEWTLIHQSSGVTRELPALISWANPEDPNVRQVIIAPEQGAKVEVGGTTSVSVGREDGLDEGCFLTAPDGATVPVFANTWYPGITLNRPNRFTSCVVAIRPMDDTAFGRWTLAAIYNAGGERIESRQPFNILRDDGIRTLSTTYYYTHQNDYIDINLNQTGAVGTCILKSPDGSESVLDASFSLSGVTVHHSSKFVSCRVTIGPVTTTHLNDWVLIQRIPGENERRQPVNIQYANPGNSNLVSRDIITGEERIVVSDFGDIVSVTTSHRQGLLEGCFLRAPDGSVLRISADRRYPGVRFSRGNSVSPCSALLGPIDDNMAGTWTIAATFNDNGARTEMQQPTIIKRNSATETVLPTLDHITSVGAFVDINLNAIDKTMDNCRIVTPDHEVHTLNETFNLRGVRVHNHSRLVTCQVTIGPMHHDLLGQWTLIEHNTDGTLRRRSVNIAWAYPVDPLREARKMVIAARQDSIVNEGGYVTVSVPREPGFDEGCFVVTPDRVYLPISQVTSYPRIEWTSRPTSISACSVRFGPVDAEMASRWVVGARFNDAGVRIEKHQPVHITLANGTTTLPMLQYYTHGDAYVDINLNQTGTTGTCLLVDPRGQEHALNVSAIPGVKMRKSDQLVSCRVTIGPMSNSLVGEWILIEQQAALTRRQPVVISWIDPSNPTLKRDVSIGTKRYIDADVGNVFSVSIGRQNGTLEGCFMITPLGASLPIFPNTRYPGVVFTGYNSVTSCMVQIGPVDIEMTGEWTLVAKYNYHGVRTELQNTINIYIRESLNVVPIVLPRQEQLLSAGANIDISLNNNGVTGECRLTTPAGEEYILDGPISIPGVTVRNSDKYVVCRVTVGPLTEELLGEWILAHLSNTNDILRQQPIRISWANPLNPSQHRELIVAAQRQVVVDTGDIFSVSISREDGFGEGCFVITPNGAYLPVTDDVSYPGISWIHRPTSVSACTIQFGPVDTDMVGRWTVAARFNHGGFRIESHQPVHLFIGDGTSYLPFVEYLTHVGGTIDIAINQTGVSGRCHLIDPSEKEHSLDLPFSLTGITVHNSDSFVSCWVTFGPMTEELLGEWLLIERSDDGTERRQPTRIVWANLQDPTADSREIIISDEQHVVTERGGTISLNGQRHDSGQFEGCFIIPPDGAMLPIFPAHDYPGITFTGARSTAPCVVDIGPMEGHMVGKWILASRFNTNGERVEIRLPAEIDINNPVSAWVIVVSVLAGLVVIAVILLFAFKRSRNWSARSFSRLRSSMRSNVSSRNNLVHQEMNQHGSISVQ